MSTMLMFNMKKQGSSIDKKERYAESKSPSKGVIQQNGSIKKGKGNKESVLSVSFQKVW